MLDTRSRKEGAKLESSQVKSSLENLQGPESQKKVGGEEGSLYVKYLLVCKCRLGLFVLRNRETGWRTDRIHDAQTSGCDDGMGGYWLG